MPDFIACNINNGKTHFIEVKYRGFIDQKDGKSECKIDFLNDYNKYWEGTKLVLVNPRIFPYFFVIDLSEVKNDMCRKEKVGLNKWEYYWNFKDIQKGIKDLFPDLQERVLEDAIKLIPNLKNESNNS